MKGQYMYGAMQISNEALEAVLDLHDHAALKPRSADYIWDRIRLIDMIHQDVLVQANVPELIEIFSPLVDPLLDD